MITPSRPSLLSPPQKVDRWPHNNYVKKLRRRDGCFYYYDRKRECPEKDLQKVKLYIYWPPNFPQTAAWASYPSTSPLHIPLCLPLHTVSHDTGHNPSVFIPSCPLILYLYLQYILWSQNKMCTDNLNSHAQTCMPYEIHIHNAIHNLWTEYIVIWQFCCHRNSSETWHHCWWQW